MPHEPGHYGGDELGTFQQATPADQAAARKADKKAQAARAKAKAKADRAARKRQKVLQDVEAFKKQQANIANGGLAEIGADVGGSDTTFSGFLKNLNGDKTATGTTAVGTTATGTTAAGTTATGTTNGAMRIPYEAEADPRGPYFAAVAQQARSPNEQRYLAGQFQNVLSEFLGSLAQQSAQTGTLGTPPSFSEYLAANPLGERYMALSPGVAGRGTRRYSPTTRWLTSY